MGALLIFDRLQLVCVYLDGGATEIADFTANEGFFALNALHVGHDAGKVAVDDAHFVALLERLTLYLGLPCRHDSAEILKRVIRNGIGDTFSRFGEDFVDIGAEADLIEIFVFHSHKDKGGEKERFMEGAPATAVCPRAFFQRQPSFQSQDSVLEVFLNEYLEFLLLIDPDTSHIPVHRTCGGNGFFSATSLFFEGWVHGSAVVPCDSGRPLWWYNCLCHLCAKSSSFLRRCF